MRNARGWLAGRSAGPASPLSRGRGASWGRSGCLQSSQKQCATAPNGRRALARSTSRSSAVGGWATVLMAQDYALAYKCASYCRRMDDLMLRPATVTIAGANSQRRSRTKGGESTLPTTRATAHFETSASLSMCFVRSSVCEPFMVIHRPRKIGRRSSEGLATIRFARFFSFQFATGLAPSEVQAAALRNRG